MWGPFLSILYAKGYDRGISIEPHSKVWSGELGEKGIDYAVEYLKRIILK